MTFSADNPATRYHRQTLLSAIGTEGQTRLSTAHALLIGCGALGTVAVESLVRAGVGHVSIVDRDLVEWTNLQRQVLFDEQDAVNRVPKAEAAAARLAKINSHVRVTPIVADVNARNVLELCAGVQVVVDATDNFQTRYLLNDACVKLGLPLVYGGAVGTSGMTLTILPKTTACLRCVFPEPPMPGTSPTCDTAGVLGPAVGVIANLQAAEAIKILAGHTEDVCTTLRDIDVWSGRLRSIAVERDSRCVCCGQGQFEFLNAPVEASAVLCGADAVQVMPAGGVKKIDLDAVATRLASVGPFVRSRHMLRGKIATEEIELTLFADGRAILKGTTDAGRAKSLYARFVGE